MAADPIIRVRGLRYRYPGTDQDVLRIPSLDVTGSGLIALTGPSGVGKSTLIELLAGTIREDYEGSLQVLGSEWKELTKDSVRQRQLRRIGLIPQDFGLLGSRTPRETLGQDISDAEVPEAEHVGRIDRALREVDLGGFADRPISGLSGGQRQRVAIARMLARDVDLVIADEPTANLDPELVGGVLDLFRRLAKRVPVLIVTHDPRIAEACDRTIVLQANAALDTAVPQTTKITPRRFARSVALTLFILVAAGGTALGVLRMRHTPSTGRGSSAKPSGAPATVPVPRVDPSISPPVASPSPGGVTAAAVWKQAAGAALTRLQQDCGAAVGTAVGSAIDACVTPIMEQFQADPEAVAYFDSHHAFLIDLGEMGAVDLGEEFDPWYANGNTSPVLLNGVPGYVRPDGQKVDLVADSNSLLLSHLFPKAEVSVSEPVLEAINKSQGGEQFVFQFLIDSGCHACSTAYAVRASLGFDARRTYLGTARLNVCHLSIAGPTIASIPACPPIAALTRYATYVTEDATDTVKTLALNTIEGGHFGPILQMGSVTFGSPQPGHVCPSGKEAYAYVAFEQGPPATFYFCSLPNGWFSDGDPYFGGE